ncbi:Hypothetical predicted protein, partial [Marmota monax]
LTGAGSRWLQTGLFRAPCERRRLPPVKERLAAAAGANRGGAGGGAGGGAE